MRLFYCGLLTLFLSGCAHQYDLLKANAVSMKHRHLPTGAELVKVADISAEYCIDNFKTSTGKDIGLMDSVIEKAEKEHNVDFIVNAVFRAKGQCMILEGEGMRIK